MTAQRGATAQPRQVNRVRQLCGMVLVMEAIVIALAIVPAKALEHVNGAVAGGVGGGLVVLAVLLSGVVGRPRMGWALAAGTILQILVIASGIWVHAMYVLGVIFGGLWLTGIWLARRIERETLERQAMQQQTRAS